MLGGLFYLFGRWGWRLPGDECSYGLSSTRMAKATDTTLALGELLCRLPADALVAGDDELCDTLAILDSKWLVREIDQHNAYLSSVIGVYGAGAIEYRNAMLVGEP